jgi:hypothetical protein
MSRFAKGLIGAIKALIVVIILAPYILSLLVVVFFAHRKADYDCVEDPNLQ